MADSSSDPEYSSVIGHEFVLMQNVRALGISSTNKPPVDNYVLVEGIGFAGPEVVRECEIQKGTAFEVTKVLTGYVLFSKKVQYVIALKGSNQLEGEDVRITLKESWQDMPFKLDSNFYRVVSE